MAVWLIIPKEPLIFRDGKPFSAIPGATAQSLRFPFPSTITGATRTREGLDENGVFQKSEISRILKMAVQGPFLVELDEMGEIKEWLMPAPSDALVLQLKDESYKPNESTREATNYGVIKKLVPLESPKGASTDLPEELALVGLEEPIREKPHPEAPRYWHWSYLQDWLIKPEEKPLHLAEIGSGGPSLETPRIHVSIDSETRVAREGALFQTQGLEFYVEQKQYALAVSTNGSNIKPGVAPLGGERRLVNWTKSDKKLLAMPDGLRQLICQDGYCRLILQTPAYFLQGWKPTWLLTEQCKVKPELKAMVLQRHQVISGWDMQGKKGRGCPKPTRRLVPAGSVLFLQLPGTESAREKWCEQIWLNAVSDVEQDRLDGFGIALLGSWDGAYCQMGVK